MLPDNGAGRPASDGRRPAWSRWVSFEGLLSGLNSIGTLWIFALMIVVNLDVIGRTAFTAPLPGVPELVRLSIVGIIFIQLAHTLRAGRLTRSDGLLSWLRRRWRRFGFALQGSFALGGAALFAVLFYASYPFFLRSWATAEYAGIEGYITFPVWPVRLIILVGCACAIVQFLIFAWRDLMVLCGRENTVEPEGGDAVA